MDQNFDIAAIAAALAADPRLAAQLSAAIAAQNSPVPPMPVRGASGSNPLPLSTDLTALQATFFDNTTNGQKPKNKSLYALTLEFWTAPAGQINISKPQGKMSTELYEYWSFGDKFHQLHRGGSISQAYYDEIHAEWTSKKSLSSGPHLIYFGLLRTKVFGSGTVFFDRQFAWVVVEKATRQVIIGCIHNGGTRIPCEFFSGTTSKGNPLAKTRNGNAASTCPISLFLGPQKRRTLRRIDSI